MGPRGRFVIAVLVVLGLFSAASIALAGSGQRIFQGGYTLKATGGATQGTGAMNSVQTGGGQSGQASLTASSPWGTGTFQLVWNVGAGEYWAYDSQGAYVGEMNVIDAWNMPPMFFIVDYYDANGGYVSTGSWEQFA
jgi:hypothetical protein